MKIELDVSPDGSNRIDSYSATCITVSGISYTKSLIVSPDRIIKDWPPRPADAFASEHLGPLFELDPELILLGTGTRLQFPPNQISVAIMQRNIGLEIMDTGAACRSYNFLAAEGRRVVAALLITGH